MNNSDTEGIKIFIGVKTQHTQQFTERKIGDGKIGQWVKGLTI